MKQQSTLKAWVAREKDGRLYLYLSPPIKRSRQWLQDINTYCLKIDRDLFPEVKWEDEEPTEVRITIKRNEESKIKSAMSFLCRIALFVSILLCTVVGLLHVIQWIIWQTFRT